VKGGCPATVINRTIATAKRSTDSPKYGLLSYISGAIYPGVPNLVFKNPFPSLPFIGPEKARL